MPLEPPRKTAQNAANNYLFIRHIFKEEVRLITFIDGYPFYRSTGQNSKQSETFFPFNGLTVDSHVSHAYMKPFETEAVFPPDLQTYINRLQSYEFQRFGNLHCMIISMSIGGGYWNSDDGKNLASFINEHYVSDVLKIQADNKDYFAALKTVDIQKIPCEVSCKEVAKEFQMRCKINQALLEKNINTIKES